MDEVWDIGQSGAKPPAGRIPVNASSLTCFDPPQLLFCLYARDALQIIPTAGQPVLGPLEPPLGPTPWQSLLSQGPVVDEWTAWWSSLIHGAPHTLDPLGPVESFDDLQLSNWPTLAAAMTPLFDGAREWVGARAAETQEIRGAADSRLDDLEHRIFTSHWQRFVSPDAERRFAVFLALPIMGNQPYRIVSRQFEFEDNDAKPKVNPPVVYFVSRAMMLNRELYKSWLLSQFPQGRVN